MFRGPNGQGVLDRANLPTRFGPQLNVTWKVSLPEGHSSPILVGKRIYLTGIDGDQLVTLGLDRATGAQVWRKVAPRRRTEALDSRNGPAAASPVSDGTVVVVFFGDFGLVGYDLDGRELWQRPLGPFNNVYGTGASPLIVDDKVILVVDQQKGSFLVAVDKTTGSEVWRVERSHATSGHCTPVEYRPEGGPAQILVAGSFLLTSYSAATGETLWWVGGLPFEMKSTPSIEDGRLFIHGYGSPMNEVGTDVEVQAWEQALTGDRDGDGKLSVDEITNATAKDWLSFVDLDGDALLDTIEWRYLLAALASKNAMIAIKLPEARAQGDLTEEHVLWRYYRRVPQLPSPLTYRGALWMVNDRALTTVLDPASGNVLAQGRIDGLVDSIYSSPVAGGGKVYIVGRAGKIAVLSADAAREGSLSPLAVNDLDETIVATPALDQDHIYIRTRAHLYAFGVATP